MRRAPSLLVLVALVACERAEPDQAHVDPAPVPDTTTPVEVAPAMTTVDSLRVALDRLVAGASGRSTWFSAQTAGAVREVGFDSTSRGATVDFIDLRALIPNASSSAGSQALLRELNEAVFSVGGIDWVQYGMDGDCELFGEWLQYGECLVFTREAAAAG